MRALKEAAGETGVTLPVYVEVNMGGNRCGVEPGEPALQLATQIADAPHLAFAGLQAYHGSAQHLRGWDERRQAIAQAADRAGRTRDLLERHGIECPTITGAGTGSFEFEAASGVYTELQCGSYIFMDADYGRNRDRDGEPIKSFEPSLFVWATVMSRPAEDRARRDRRARLRPAWQSAVSAATSRLGLGGKIPGHCDPTVNPQPLPHEREG